MKANPDFSNLPKSFWATVRSVSQSIGYTVRNEKTVKVPTVNEIKNVFKELDLDTTVIISNEEETKLAENLIKYYEYRASILNDFVEPRLMDATLLKNKKGVELNNNEERAKLKFEELKFSFSEKLHNKLSTNENYNLSIDQLNRLLSELSINVSSTLSGKLSKKLLSSNPDDLPEKLTKELCDSLSKDLEESLNNLPQDYLKILLARIFPLKLLLPMNKQTGNKKDHALFTGMINMLIYENLQEFCCDYDPRQLTTITKNGSPLRTLARRVDGAFPSTVNPIAIWEIKEYYYTTTFGSRVADGVYETLLDGMELEDLYKQENIKVLHYLMIDSHYTWWQCGKPYLCRIIDMLHMGYVSEVLFGYEIIEKLPEIVKEWIEIEKEINK